MAVGSVVAVVLATSLALSGCGGDNQHVSAAGVAGEGAFRVVGTEEVGLNGAENVDRPPISFTLLGTADGTSSAGEAELVELYAEKLEAKGWKVAAHKVPDDWWTVRGTDGSARVRIGPASRFVEMATIDEGFSRTKFRGLVAEEPGPLIVVSMDPSG